MKNISLLFNALLFSTTAVATGVSNPYGGSDVGIIVIIVFVAIAFFQYYFHLSIKTAINHKTPEHIRLKDKSTYSIILFWVFFFIYGLFPWAPLLLLLFIIHIYFLITPLITWRKLKNIL